jgi:predicted transcriptional regulator
MSARAAWRLETLGFTQVYRYTAGKQEWFAAGLPREGRLASVIRAGDVARADVPTCGLTDRVGEVRDRIQAAGWDQCLVVNEQLIVLGRLRGERFEAPAETPVEQIMEPGPTTFRPDIAIGMISEWIESQDLSSVLVTSMDGEFIGVVFREDVARILAEHTHDE